MKVIFNKGRYRAARAAKNSLVNLEYQKGFELVKIAVSELRHKSASFQQIVQFPKILFLHH